MLHGPGAALFIFILFGEGMLAWIQPEIFTGIDNHIISWLLKHLFPFYSVLNFCLPFFQMSDCDKGNVFIYSAIFSHNEQRNHVYFESQSDLVLEVKRQN